MLPFWPFFTMPAWQAHMTRQARLQDLDDRMASYLADKTASDITCPRVLENVHAARTAVQRELATHS